MSETRFNQLRFDISEKVRLHPQQPGIGTLLELDLYPDVEIRDEGKHLKIQGYLRLNGAYLGDAAGNQANVATTAQAEVREDLAYVIPVEITIPADRAELGNISAEVESFDYSVVSPFELQVEAILAIDGLLPEERKETKPVKKEFTKKESKKAATRESAEPTFTAEPMVEEMPVVEQNEQENGFREFSGSPVSKADTEQKNEVEKDVHRPELHFSANRNAEDNTEETHEPTSVEYLHNLWNRKKASEESEELFAQDQFAMEKELEQNAEQPSYLHSTEGSRDTQWVGWLMRSKDESFTSMRMVISQKDESIDDIADKYGMPVGQLRSINHLEEDQIDEGQIIYIPRQLQRTS